MVFVHLAEGFEEIEAVTVIDVLRRMGLETYSVSVSGNKAVTGAHGIVVEANLLFEEADYEKCRLLVLPGGMPGTKNLHQHQGLLEQVKTFVKNGKLVGAICAAPMILGEEGLLKGKSATIYPGMEKHLVGANIKDAKVVVDGQLITGRGPGAAAEFALILGALLAGNETAQRVRAGLIL